MNAKLKLLTMILAAACMTVNAEETSPMSTVGQETEVQAAAPVDEGAVKPKRTRRTRARKAVTTDGTEAQPKTKRRTRRSRKCMSEVVPMLESDPATEAAPVDANPTNME